MAEAAEPPDVVFCFGLPDLAKTHLINGIPFVTEGVMLQLNPPLVRVVVGGAGWSGPTGKGVANLVDPGHRDDDIIWIIDLDENGQTWCVPNRYVRAPTNITYGRKAERVAETNGATGNGNGRLARSELAAE